jgi:hypothetical protein
MKQKRLPDKLQAWVDARKKHRLSHAHVQMARELGLNPKKFGSYDNHKQEPWKVPLPEFIEDLYVKRFKRSRPERVLTIEEIAQKAEAKNEEKGASKPFGQPLDAAPQPGVSERQVQVDAEGSP